jgi:hypothetical protein
VSIYREARLPRRDDLSSDRARLFAHRHVRSSPRAALVKTDWDPLEAEG